MKRISVVGIGKLGLSMVGAIASRGFQVHGVDVRRDVIDALQRGDCPLVETGLPELLRENRDRIVYTMDLREAVQKTDITFVVVATPLIQDNRFSNAYLEEAVREIGRALQGSSQAHLVAVVSTVMPGTMHDVVKPLLESESGRRCGDNLLLAYNPEFIALGTVIRDFLEPDWVLVGEDSPEAGDWLAEFYAQVCKMNPRVQRMAVINAEIAKLSLNCYITTKISFANSLGSICEKVKGADAGMILKAIGLDSRIGGKALLPGLGFGGPCFPRDNLAFQSFAKEFGSDAVLSEAVQRVNRQQPRRIIEFIQSHIPSPADVAILGTAYKPKTDVIEESQSVMIAHALAEEGYRVRVFDALAKSRLETELGELVEVSSTIEEACRGAEVCFFGLPLGDNLDPKILLGWMKPPRWIIDPWSHLSSLSRDSQCRYVAIGRYFK